MSVAIVVGRFSPIHNGHKAMFETAQKVTGQPPIVAVVRGKDKEKNPFSAEMRQAMLAEMGYHSVVVPTAFTCAKAVQDEFDVVVTMLVAGSDRAENYRRMVTHDDFGAKVQVVEVSRTAADLSASMVRTAIHARDWGLVKDSVPSPVFHFVKTIALSDGL